MMSRIVPVGLLAAGCLTAAAGGSYLAVRHSAAQQPAAATAPAPAVPAPAVNETEGIVAPAPDEQPNPSEPAVERAEPPRVTPPPAEPRRPATRTPPARPAPARAASTTAEPVRQQSPTPAAGATAPAIPAVEPLSQHAAPVQSAIAPVQVEPVFDEIVVPSSSVIGLELENTVTSETARLEDRVDARVTRDVYADGRLAIPAGSRAIGAVTIVERGGKVRERARLGVRFHTLVLAGGRQVNLRTQEIFRDGESPANDSSRKIGGAAVGGAVLGAIIGGGKGALIGGATGAAGGTAITMAGDRKPATFNSGTVVTVKLTAPVAVEVER